MGLETTSQANSSNASELALELVALLARMNLAFEYEYVEGTLEEGETWIVRLTRLRTSVDLHSDDYLSDTTFIFKENGRVETDVTVESLTNLH